LPLVVHVSDLVRLSRLDVFDNEEDVLEKVVESAEEEMVEVGDDDSGVEVPEVGELERGEEVLDE